MKLFGRGNQKTNDAPGGGDQTLQRAIKIVRSNRKIDSIEDQRDAELVLDVLLEGFGDMLHSRQIGESDLTLEQTKEQVLHKVQSIHQLLDSPDSTNEIRAALSSFVFNAGVAFGAPAHIVLSAFDAMIASDDLNAYQSLADTDSVFSGHLRTFISELTPKEARGFAEAFDRASQSVPQLAIVFGELSAASEVQAVKSSKAKADSSVTLPSGKPPAKSKFCGQCGTPHDVTAKFCGSCGNKVSN